MKRTIGYLLVATFSIFVGSQITEGALFVPYWQSLSADEFYSYYNSFGPFIGRFYTVLTIVSALIPVGLSIYLKITHSKALLWSLASTCFAILFVASFYIYFKDVNEMFYQSAFSEKELAEELITWSRWHWGRVTIELASLITLILAFNKAENGDHK